MQVVRFRTGDGLFAIDVAAAREVRLPEGLRPLPAARPGVAGVLDRRGEALPILDALGPGDRHVLVLGAEGELFGLLVAEVLGVGELDERTIAAAPAGQDADVVVGAAPEGDGLMLLVDADALLSRFRP